MGCLTNEEVEGSRAEILKRAMKLDGLTALLALHGGGKEEGRS